MAKKPKVMRDSLSRIKEKISVAKDWVDYFGYEESPYAGETFFENEASSAVLDFKLNLYVLYHIFKDLGVGEKKLQEIASLIASDCMEVEDGYCSIDACFKLGYMIVPFWELNIEDSYWLFDKDDNGYELGAEDGDDIVESTIVRFLDVFHAMGCSEQVNHYVECSKSFYEIAANEYYYSEELNVSFFFVHSDLLKYYLRFRDGLTDADKRSFYSRKLVRELEEYLKRAFSGLHPCTRYCEHEDVGEGFYLFAAGDYCGQVDYALSQLCANYTAGLNANIIDLYIFALDEKFHFLPEEYAGRSYEIFPDFVSRKAKKRETA